LLLFNLIAIIISLKSELSKYIFPISPIKNIYKSKLKKLAQASFTKVFQLSMKNLFFLLFLERQDIYFL